MDEWSTALEGASGKLAKCRLTGRSTGAPTAGHLAREPLVVHHAPRGQGVHPSSPGYLYVRRHSMRLWSLHPKYLDPQGLVALWRESLLAKAVLRGETRGYTNHPQLERFKAHPQPRFAINSYLAAIHAEATERGYAFDPSKIGPVRTVQPIPVSTGQLALEWGHLQRKLATRSPAVLARWSDLALPACHPLFRQQPGSVASWERASGGA